jgi:TPR repeat protein
MARMNMQDFETAEMASGVVNAEALYDLGLKFSAGKGVDANLVEAHKWFNIASMRGNAQAREYRMELAEEMTTEEIAEAQRQARDWLQAH